MDLNQVRLAAPYVVGAVTAVAGMVGAAKAAPAVYARMPTTATVRAEAGRTYARANQVARATTGNVRAFAHTTAQNAATTVQKQVQNTARSTKESVRAGVDGALQAVEANVYVKKLQQQCQAIEKFQKEFFEKLNTPTLEKVAGVYALAALTVTAGAVGVAVSTPSLFVAVPAVGAAIVGVGVIFGIYNTYAIAKDEGLPYFRKHIKFTLYSHVAFFTSVNVLGLATLGVVMLDRHIHGGRGSIIIRAFGA